MDHLNKNDIIAVTVTFLSMFIEEVFRHPIGTITSVLGALYMYNRWRRERAERIIKEKQLKDS
tara:strand:+ start:367 stop:555 length:189 start_codon:yes stop_codon:yes gene_type:complete